MKEVGVYAASKDYDSMVKKLADLKTQAVNTETEITSRARSIDLLESEIETKKLSVIESEKEVNEVGKRVATVNGKLQEAENEKIVIKERARASNDKLEEIAGQKLQKRQAVESRGEELEAASSEIEVTLEEITAKTSALAALESEFAEAGGKLEALREKSVAFAREKLQNIQAEIDAASSLTEVRSKQTHVSELITKLEAKESAIAAGLEVVTAEVTAMKSEAADLKSESESSREDLTALTSIVAELGAKMDAIREERAPRPGATCSRSSSNAMKDMRAELSTSWRRARMRDRFTALSATS
jgi:chromosome segregation ATPase